MNSTILTVMRKELARFFGDYRMVMTTILLPGILIFVLYQFMGDAMLSQFTTDKFAPKCTAVNIPDDWSAELKKTGFRIHKGNADTMDSARQKVKDQKAELCIVFPEDFAKQVEEYAVNRPLILQFIIILHRRIPRTLMIRCVLTSIRRNLPWPINLM